MILMADDISRLETAFEKGVQKLDTRVEDLRNDFQNFQIQMAGRVQSIEDASKAAHYRIEQHEKGHRANLSLWIGSIIGVAGIIAAIVMALVKKG